MAQFLLVSMLVHTPPSGSGLSANDVINAYWDDSTEAIAVKKNGSAFSPTQSAQVGILNTNYYVAGITSYEGEYAISGYSFCDGNTLNWFKMPTYYPGPPYYMQRRQTADSPVCGTAVCDIHFVGPPQLTHTTDLLSNNGQIIALATSSNGTVKYSLSPFDYATGGQTSSTITGLSLGTYTLYAKDANDCTAQIQFTILFKPAYAEHYRFSWYSAQIQNGTSRHERLRIYEREYFGDVVEIDNGGSSPFVLNKLKAGNLNDKFNVIHPTNAVMSFMSEVDYAYLPMYTEDDKKYKCVYEVDEGGFTPAWSGFEIPLNYQEDFVPVPYQSQLRLADNVKLLERIKYTDDNGNLLNGDQKLIKIIAHIMKKTGLELEIRSGINIFEENHNTAATDDPLDQTYVDVSCYRREGEPFMCNEVLEAILKPFGARLYQAENQWWLEEIDRATASYAYRVFTTDGDYSSNGTYDPVLQIKAPELTNRVALVDRDHSMGIIPSYGKVTVTSKFNYVGSIVEGSFEKADLLSPESEITTYFTGIFQSGGEENFKGWSLRLPDGIQGVSFGRSVIDEEDRSFIHISDADKAVQSGKGRSVGAFYFNANQWTGNLRDAYIESAAKPFQYGPNDQVRIRFDYSTLGAVGYPFIILRFALKIGTKYLTNDFKTWSTTETILRAYPQPSSKLQTYETYVKVPETSAVVDSTIQMRIYYYAADFYDFGMPSATDSPDDATDGITDLIALDTDDIEYPYQADFRFHDGNGGYGRPFVELRLSTADEDIQKGIIHPHDFNSTTNGKIWWVVGNVMEGQKTVDPAGHDYHNRLFYVDNVSMDALPNGQAPPLEETLPTAELSRYVDEAMEIELYNSDLLDVRNAKNMYNNYFKLSDGTPTSAWARSGVSESSRLQEILLKVLGSNHAAPTFRLTGSFVNEFARIGPQNYIKLVKPGSGLIATNTTFDSDLTGWTQVGTGTSFAWSSDNSGSAEVTLTGAVDSKKFTQAITHSGGYIKITGNVAVVPDAANDREDVLSVVFYRGASIVHMEKIHTFQAPASSTTETISHTAFCPGSITAIGFYIRNVNGTGECTYQVGEFSPDGTDITEIYQIADFQGDMKNNSYTLELMQLSKTYISLASVDSGGTNQSGGTTGRAHSSGHSSGYN